MKRNGNRLKLLLGSWLLLIAFSAPWVGMVARREARAESVRPLAATADLVSSWDPIGTNAHDGVFVQGGLAYLTDWVRDLDVVDITNPANPVWLGNLPMTGQGMDVVVDGDYAYVAMKSGGLRIVDVSDPFHMAEVGSIKANPTQDDLALHLFKAGNLVYVADEMFGVVIYNVSTPSNPSKVGVCNIGFAESVWVQGSYAYVTGGNNGLYIYDVSNPSSPVLRATLPKIGYSYDVQVVGNFAYVAEGVAGLRVIDVSNPASPQHLTIVPTASEAYDVRVAEGYAYVAERNVPGHVEVFDLANPAAPVLVSRYQSAERVSGVYPAGGYVYCAAYNRGLLVLDPMLGPTATPTATATRTVTPTPTITVTPTITPQPTPTIDSAATMTLTLQVTLQGRGSAPSAAWVTPLHVSLVSPSGLSGPLAFDASCNNSGRLTLANVPQGMWDISVRDGSSLANVRRGVILSAVALSLDMDTLLAGDTNLDSVINILDFSVLASVYGAEAGDGRYQARSDLNSDGHINILDFAMLANNYGQSGPRDL